MKKILFFILGVLFLESSIAQIPDGYYNIATDLNGEELITALHNIIDNHTVKTYGDARYILDETDKDPANSSNIILVYTGNSISSNWDAGASWNREHVWSKSHGFPDEGDVPYSDLHNLKPSHPTVNTDRSDKDFDEGGSPHSIATNCNYTSTTWEPRDDVKGDIARIMLYMSIRYQGDVSGEPDLELLDVITSYPDPEFGIFSTLIKWHYEDPVDNFERNRNDIIYSYQNNRNPFIDHPEYVSLIWGGGTTNPAPIISNITNNPIIPSPSETVTITADISDDSGITNANLNWGLISGALNNTISLTHTSADLYTSESDIPAQTDGTIVFYEIEATDDSSGVSISEECNYEIDNNPPTEILNEDFESCPATGWTSYSVSGNKDWECSDNGYLYINAYDGTGASDDWFISPSINLDIYMGEYLSFTSWTKYTDTQSPTIELKYSTDYTGSGDPNVASWTNLSPTWSAEDSQTWTESGKVDLSDISGTNIYIAFRYISSGNSSSTCTSWEIDNIYLTETNNILPEISEISNTPMLPNTGEDVDISAKITDSDGTISSANIKWGTSSGSYPNSISMTGTNDIYSGTIPAQTEGSFVYFVIEANDNSAETRQSLENVFSYNSTGNSVPIISNININPEAPTSSDGVAVSATITDTDGSISIAQMKWGTASGVYQYNIDLEKSTDVYSGYIPKRPEDTTIHYIIYTADNNGGSTVSLENNYLINDPPKISNVNISPDKPTEGETVTVYSDIIDNNGSISSAILKWKTLTGTYTDINMDKSGNTYTGVIPAQSSGENILYSIETSDNLGASSNYTFGNYIVGENIPPKISDVSFRPSAPTQNDSVTVSANVNDQNGSLISVILKWKISTGNYTNIDMISSENLYSGIIPPQAVGENILFSIEATDNLDSTTNYTDGNYSITNSTDLHGFLKNKLLIYPIPAINEVCVELENYSGNFEIQLYNIDGKAIYSDKVFIEKSITIPLNKIKPGVYFIKIRNNENTFVQKIIKGK